MNQKEPARLSVLNSVLGYQVPITQAAELWGVSERPARRMLAAYREQGALPGRRAHNTTSPTEVAAVVELASQHYEGANHTHFTELLREREGIDLSRPTVRTRPDPFDGVWEDEIEPLLRNDPTGKLKATTIIDWLAEQHPGRILTRAGIGSPRIRRSTQYRFRRLRMPQAGMLVQLDGSHHAWLEEQRPKFARLLAGDDATGAVVNALFRTGEDTRGYFMPLEGLIQRWGIPLEALYSDRHAVFKHNARLPETAADATQFTAAGHGDALATFLEVLEQEAEDRRHRRINRLRRESRLPSGKTWETFEHDRVPLALRQQLDQLAQGSFVERGINVLAFGLPGTGKTHARCALGHRLVEAGHSVLFAPAYRLVQELLAAKRDLDLPRQLRKLDNFDFLLLDDLGYLPQGAEESEVLFTLIAERYERRSLGITSNLVFSEWERIFANPMATAAAIDRVVHHSVILEFDVPSYRTNAAQQRVQAKEVNRQN